LRPARSRSRPRSAETELTGTSAGLREDVQRRLQQLQRVIEAQDLSAVLAVSTGAPSQTGWIRYLTGADLWASQAFVIVERGNPEPVIVLWSNYLAEWIKTMATTRRIESTLLRRIAPIERVIEILSEISGGRGRLGGLNVERSLFAPDYQALRSRLPGLELIDLTDEVNRLRQIKSPFEVQAIGEMGNLLVQGFRMFEERARPGRSTLAVASEVEGFLRGRGCFWGRAKYSLDQRPYTLPAAPGRNFADDDVVLFQFVYQSPLGYWYEVARLYSFRPLPAETERVYRATDEAIHESAAASIPGRTYGELSMLSDRIFRKHGLNVVGKHTEDCHSIGTDISDGPTWYTDEWSLQENMVLALHPASLVEGDRAFFICENYLVEAGGATALSPLESFYRRLPSS
jgi:Xaa-Pro aminopeptidase